MAEKKAAAKQSTRLAENSGKQRRAAKPPATAPANQTATAEEIAEKQRHAGLLATSAIMNGAAVIHPLQKNLIGADATTDGIYEALSDKLKSLQAGDMTAIESMLLSQAVSLQTIYASLARKAAAQDYLKQYQVHLTLALKAQAQSRATLEALIELKQPRHPATFVRQANIANGPQQVNQHTYAGMPAHTAQAGFPEQYAQARAPAGISQTEPNRLLEATHETQGHPAPGRVADPVAVGRAGEG